MWSFEDFLIKGYSSMPDAIIDHLKLLGFLFVNDNISNIDFKFVQIEL